MESTESSRLSWSIHGIFAVRPEGGELKMSVIIELERGHCIEQMEARQIARKAVSTILSELPEELQTGDVVTYILKEAKMTAKCAKIKL